MTPRHVTPALALATSAVIGAGLALTSVPAYAGSTHATPDAAAPASAQVVTPRPLITPDGKAIGRLSPAQLEQVRARQQQMRAHHAEVPTLSRRGATTFTVDTTEDSDLANPAATTCVDAATAGCSLRAAVDAANNLDKPTTIVLGAHTYTLTSATTLNVTNPAGTSIVGAGSPKTTIAGDGSGVFHLDGAAHQTAGLLLVSDAKVTGGDATYGGGFYLDDTPEGSSLVLDHVIVSGNTASIAGGGVYASEHDTVYARHTHVTGNQAYEGAGIYEYWADLDLTNVTVDDNLAPSSTLGYGGGLYSEYGVVRITGGSISGDTVGGIGHQGAGAGIYDQYGNVALTDVHVDHDTADGAGQGGGIVASDDLVDVDGGTISHNHANGADGEGGGIFENYGSQLRLRGVRMVGNRVGEPTGAGYGGGALYLYGSDGYGNQTTIDRGSRITGSNGSAIYADADQGQIDLRVADSALSENHNDADNAGNGDGCGGAVCAFNATEGTMNVSLSGDTVEGNSSTGDGGSGAVSVFAYDIGGASVRLLGNRFESNVAGAGGYGGAVLFWGNDSDDPMSVRSQSNTFVKNEAGTSADVGWGGALAIYYYATFTDKGSTFAKNTALGEGAYGGAIFDESYQSSRFTGTRFTGNRAGPTTDGNGYGGAMYSADEAGTTLTRVTMSGNTAASYGGGLYGYDEYSTSVEQSTISGNTAGTAAGAGHGGGIYTVDSALVLENSTVADNTALSISGTPGQGGGVYTYDGSVVDIRFTTVSGNVAQQGGGIYAATDGANVMASIIDRNHASTGGSEQDCTTAGGFAQPHSLGSNVLGQAGCVTATRSADKVTRKLHLGALADNGGPTETMAITAKSPAVGRASFQVPATDQRGDKRPSKHADAGAFELSRRKDRRH